MCNNPRQNQQNYLSVTTEAINTKAGNFHSTSRSRTEVEESAAAKPSQTTVVVSNEFVRFQGLYIWIPEYDASNAVQESLENIMHYWPVQFAFVFLKATCCRHSLVLWFYSRHHR